MVLPRFCTTSAVTYVKQKSKINRIDEKLNTEDVKVTVFKFFSVDNVKIEASNLSKVPRPS